MFNTNNTIMVKRHLTLVLAGAVILLNFSCSGNKTAETYPEITESNNIRNYLVKAAKDITDNSGTDYKSATDLEKLRPQRYSEFIEMISLQDMPLTGDRHPLNVKITGTIQRDGYRI